jgi:MFS family permease
MPDCRQCSRAGISVNCLQMPLPPLSPEQLVKPRYFEARIALIFASLFVSTGIYLPYFPLWLEWHGFGAEQIAVILAAPMFLRVVTTPLLTALADRARDRVDVLLVLVAASVAICCGYFLPPAYGIVLAVSLALSVVWTPHGPLADSLALSGVRRFGSNYTKMRIWGSIAFLSANLAGGVILSWTSPQAVPVIMVVSLAVAIAVVAAAPRLGRPRRASPLSADDLQGAPKLLNRDFVLIIAGAGLINGSHGFMYGFASIYWKSIGLGDTLIGFLWAFAVLAEVGIFTVFRAGAALSFDRPVADRHPEADRRDRAGGADRGRARCDVLRQRHVHGRGHAAFRPALRSLGRLGLLRHDRRRRTRHRADPAVHRLSPKEPARAVTPASPNS